MLVRMLLVGVTAATFAAPAVAGTVTAHSARHHRHHHRSHHGIPQHNGGDHDADNRGGPSDGDGRT